jgi:phosphomannomutase
MIRREEMGELTTVEGLYETYIVANNHAKSDYFGLIRELVSLRQRFPADSEEYRNFQRGIDGVYDLIENEILTNQGLPLAPVKFGTSGWRGILGKDLFVKSVGLVTAGIVAMYRELDKGSPVDPDCIAALGVSSFKEACTRGCVVGFDNRFGGGILAEEVVRVLTANGIEVHYAGEATTGTLSAALLRLQAAFSINLTPSHNPLQYGGFKYNGADGGPAAATLTDRITVLANRLLNGQDNPAAGASATPVRSLISKIDALDLWIDLVRNNRQVHGLDYDAIMTRLAGAGDIAIAVDCVHGASRLHMKRFFKGIPPAQLFLLRDNSDPTFGGIAPEPSSANIQPVMHLLAKRPEPYKLGAILDPDGDRVRFTDGESEISMNQFGALAFYYLHEEKKKRGLLAKTVATSNFANRLAIALGEEIFETRVGFKEFKPVIGQALVCFEESDGITVKGHTAEKDAYIGLLLALDLVLSLKKNLTTYLSEIESAYGSFYPAGAGIAVSKQGAALRKTLAGLERYATDSLITVGGKQRRIVDIIDIDGRKMIMEDGSWIMIRPSGTEPKVRFYVEARTAADKALLIETARSMLAEIGL